MNIPTLKDISPTMGKNLDEAVALQHFLDLDHKAAIEMFSKYDVDQLHIFSSDFSFMGKRAMIYYLKAFLDYVSTLDEEDVDDAMSVIADALDIRYRYGTE